MREQIFIELPIKIGELITQGMIKTITIKKNHRDIVIRILDDKKFEESYDSSNEILIESYIKEEES